MDIQQLVVFFLLVAGGAAIVTAFVLGRQKNVHIWLPQLVMQQIRRLMRQPAKPDGMTHIMFCVADHFEPEWGRPAFDVALNRVRIWAERYPLLARAHRDADGRHPVHTFFFPEEEYKPEYIDLLAGLSVERLGEIEVHLHHDRDTAEGLRHKLRSFKAKLAAHDALARDKNGNGRFGFIHGNWCLDNSRPDGRWCGVNNELQVLEECGCYADFTLPAAPSPAQTRQINSIYYATDDPHAPRSHDTGVPACVGKQHQGDMLLIQGVLTLNWARRSKGIFPRIENSEICSNNPPTKQRVDLWVDQGIAVRGRPEWVFIKVHTHGAGEPEFPTLLGEPMHELFRYLESRYNDGKDYCLHYVSAREMYNIVRAAEAGCAGNPNAYRDFDIMRPTYQVSKACDVEQPEETVTVSVEVRMA